MFELQLELHCRARGTRPAITADEVLEVRALLARYSGDLKGLMTLAAGG